MNLPSMKFHLLACHRSCFHIEFSVLLSSLCCLLNMLASFVGFTLWTFGGAVILTDMPFLMSIISTSSQKAIQRRAIMATLIGYSNVLLEGSALLHSLNGRIHPIHPHLIYTNSFSFPFHSIHSRDYPCFDVRFT